MTDRELLELAVKAAGIEYKEYHVLGLYTPKRPAAYWNPLTNDGDALRLAVKLKIDISFGIFASQINAEIYDFAEDTVASEAHEDGRDDPYTATRRAIVRAAAEMGQEKTNE